MLTVPCLKLSLSTLQTLQNTVLINNSMNFYRNPVNLADKVHNTRNIPYSLSLTMRGTHSKLMIVHRNVDK